MDLDCLIENLIKIRDEHKNGNKDVYFIRNDRFSGTDYISIYNVCVDSDYETYITNEV